MLTLYGTDNRHIGPCSTCFDVYHKECNGDECPVVLQGEEALNECVVGACRARIGHLPKTGAHLVKYEITSLHAHTTGTRHHAQEIHTRLNITNGEGFESSARESIKNRISCDKTIHAARRHPHNVHQHRFGGDPSLFCNTGFYEITNVGASAWRACKDGHQSASNMTPRTSSVGSAADIKENQ